MKKILRSILILLIVAAAALGLAVVFLLNPAAEKMRPLIIEKASAALNRPVQIGQISIRLLPHVSVEVSDVAIGGEKANEAPAAEGLSFKKVSLDANLSDLLSGQIKASRITLLDSSVAVSRDKSGRIFVGGIEVTPAAAPEPNAAVVGPKPAQAPSAAAPAKSALPEIEEIAIRNFSLRWDDAFPPTPQSVQLSGLTLTASNIGTASAASFSFAASLLGAATPNVQGKGSLDLGSLASGQPVFQAEISAAALDTATLVSLVRGYGVPLDQISLQGPLSITLNASGTAQGITLAPLLEASAIGITVGSAFEKAAGVPCSFAANASLLPDKTIDVSAAAIKAGGITVQSALHVVPNQWIEAKPHFAGLALADAAALVPPLRSFNPSGNVSADLSLRFRYDNGKLVPIPERSGSITIDNVSAVISGATGEKPASTLQNLNGSLNFDHDTISTTSLAGSLNGQRFDLSFRSDLTPDQLRLQESALHAFGGTFSVNGAFELQGRKSFSSAVSGSQANIGDLMHFAAPNAAVTLSGTLTRLTATAAGNATDGASSLNGRFDTVLSSGALEGVNLAARIAEKARAIPEVEKEIERSLPPDFQQILNGNATTFDSLHAAGTFQGQVAKLSEVQLDHRLYQATADGTLSAAGPLDLRAQCRLTPAAIHTLLERQPKLKYLQDSHGNVTIPVTISRAHDTLIVAPDVSELAKNAAVAAVKDNAEKTLQHVIPNLGKDSEKLIKGLFH